MVCHSRAANYVLGLTELQLNQAHDPARGNVDQLREWEQLGLFRVDWATRARGDLRAAYLRTGKTAEQADELLARLPLPEQRGARISTLVAARPERLPHLVDPADASQPLAQRARSYLHANCAHCHVEAGGGNAQMDLEFLTPDDKTRIFGVPPVHHKFAIDDPRLVAPGHPERSVLLHRISHRQAGQMPPLASSVVDAEAVALIRDWIAELAPAP